MRVLLDDRECDVQARSVDQAIAAGAALAEQNGRLIVEVQVDGAPWSDAPPGTPHGEALVQPQEVRLTSAEPRILVGQTLADASAALTGIDDAQREAAELIEADRLPEGMERLGEALRTWDELRQVIAMSAQALDLKLDEMTVGGASVPSIIDALGQQLRDVADALRAKDPVALADTLQYELQGVVQQWQELLAYLQRIVEQEDGPTCR